MSVETERTSLRELAALFLRLGATSFGGPAAHVAMLRREVVERRRWMSEERFLDLLGATNLIPGPNSTEMAIHVGYARAGFAGLVVAGACFIGPAVLITAVLAWLYVESGSLPDVAWVLYGVVPVVLAIVAQAVWKLVPRAARTWELRAIGVASIVAYALGARELEVLAGAALVAVLLSARRSSATAALGLAPVPFAGSVATAFAPAKLFLVFLKIGSVLFGSGYVLIAFLRGDLVERLHWLTERQLLDAVAVGQVTPGPLFSTATFLGFVLDGPRGASLATIGIFLPAFVFVALSGPLVPRVRASKLASAVLDGVNVASLALMAVVTAELARSALVDAPSIAIAIVGAVLLLRFDVGSTWLVLGGAALGWLAHATGVAR